MNKIEPETEQGLREREDVADAPELMGTERDGKGKDRPFDPRWVTSGLLGLLMVAGVIFVIFNQLPWETKESAAIQNQQLQQATSLIARLADQVNTLAMNQAVMQEAIRHMADESVQIEKLRDVVEQNSMHIEGLEADQKADESRRLVHHARD